MVLLAAGLSAPLWAPVVLTRRSERSMSAPARMEAIARALALYCNSVEAPLRSDALGTGWLPPEVRALGPSFATLSREGATLAFGGGFHGSGLGLARTPDAGTGAWALSFASEDDWTPPATVTVTMSERLSREALLDRLKANEAEAAASATGRAAVAAAADRVHFLLAFATPAEALAAAQEARVTLADRVGAQYLAAVVRVALGEKVAAAADFTGWVRAHPDLGNETILASYLAAEGLGAEATAAARAALAAPLVDPPVDSDVLWNCSALGSTLAATALALHEGPLALAACDRFEPAMASCGDPHFAPTFAALRVEARTPAAGAAGEGAAAGTGALIPPLDFDRAFLGHDGLRAALAAARRP